MGDRSLLCLVRAELRKIVLQRSNWALPPVAAAVGVIAAAAAADQAIRLGSFPYVIDTGRAFAAAFAGVVMLAVSARLVAMEYQEGTIRVLLARGAGPLRVLFAKLAAVGVVGLALSAALAVAGTAYVAVQLQRLPAPIAWGDVRVAALTVALSVAICGLLGAAAGAAGRSLTFAAAVAIGFFPADNVLGYLLPILSTATSERLWADLTGYLLGPALNHVPSVLMSRPAGELIPPAVPEDATHGLLVIAAYAAAFLGAVVLVTWRRETVE
jgi:hypothetical protein